MKSFAANIIILAYIGGLFPAAERADQVHPKSRWSAFVWALIWPLPVTEIMVHDFMVSHPMEVRND